MVSASQWLPPDFDFPLVLAEAGWSWSQVHTICKYPLNYQIYESLACILPACYGLPIRP